jgi:dienelactone hydrolase
MRIVASVIFLGCLLSGCVATRAQARSRSEPARAASAAARVPELPSPSGSFGIGRTAYDWTDPARPDRFSTVPNAHRELMVYVWYPTAAKSAETHGTYLPGAKQMDAAPEIRRAMREDYGGTWPLIASGAIFSHAADDAPIAKSPMSFPVVILSHGLGGSGFGYTALIENLVSHGYVVAAIDHTGTAGAVAFPDGRLVPFHQDAPPPGLPPEERFKRMMASMAAGIEEGAADVRFVLTRLMALNRVRSEFAGRLDPNRVAAMGHSAGAEFAARACQLDARFTACVDLDGGMVPVAALPESPDGAVIRQPLLFLEAWHDEAHMGGSHEEHLAYFKKREAQLEKCPAGTYAVVLRSPGMVHGSFSDDPFLEAGDRSHGIDTARHNFDLIETFVRGFLDKTLDHDRNTIFDSHQPAIPEAEIVPYGN